jgi:Zn finger protein HypA/HybF involved in hydrogenase expression
MKTEKELKKELDRFKNRKASMIIDKTAHDTFIHTIEWVLEPSKEQQECEHKDANEISYKNICAFCPKCGLRLINE